MLDFAAIDFEAANRVPSSVCSVGVVVVRGGVIRERFYSLVHPEPDYYQRGCRRVHGLGREDTCNAPAFPAVWAQVEPLIEGLPLVAHNAGYDASCLRAALAAYGLECPPYRFYDTVTAAQRHFGSTLPNHRLPTVAAACGYVLENQHHALADAEAAAAIALKIL